MPTQRLDTQRPITLYDDRNKDDVDLMVTHVLYENAEVVLVRAVPYVFNRQGLLETEDERPEHLLIALEDGTVQNSTYDSWYAENPEPTRVPAPVRGEPVPVETVKGKGKGRSGA